MAFVVCEPCRDCKYTDCVTVCPCECFYQDEEMLHIDPMECVDCEAGVPECPVEAIFYEESVPQSWTQFIQLNAECVAALKPGGGNITERQEPKLGPGCRDQRCPCSLRASKRKCTERPKALVLALEIHLLALFNTLLRIRLSHHPCPNPGMP